MLYVRMGRERDRSWWRECRACERWFFRLVVPLFLAAVVVGWLWSMTHAASTDIIRYLCPDGSPVAANGSQDPCLDHGVPIQHGVQSGFTTIEHYRCHRGAGDVVVFEPIEQSADEPLVIFLHCVNCTCEGEK